MPPTQPGTPERAPDQKAAEQMQRPRCGTWGHELLPAAAHGIYEDRDDDGPATLVDYCATCTRALTASGVFTVQHVYAPEELGTTPCPTCHGTGRIDH